MLLSPPATPQEFVLPNGLKVVLIPAPAAPVATIMIVYRVGSRDEAVGYTGSSHLLEHMLFKGTPSYNRQNGRAFADIMNEIGATKNATTWLDRTNYFETVPAGYLEFAIELEADRMRHAFVADADRRSEMTVVRNELERNDNNHARVLDAALVATAFREHPYHHPTIGWRTDVEGVSTDRLRELYDTYYHPNNATVFVLGDFDEARAREAIDARFSALPRSARPIPDVYTSEPPQAGERTVVLKRPGDTTILAYAFHTPAAFGQTSVLSRAALDARAARDLDAGDGYALDVLARVLGRGRASRLSRALVDGGLALDVAAWNWGSRDPGLFQIVVNVRPGAAVDDVRRELDRVLADLAATGPDAVEVERAQNQIAVARAFARDGTLALAQRLAEFEAVGSWRLDEREIDAVRAVTPDAVRDAVNRYLHEDNRTTGTLVPGTPKVFDVPPFEPLASNGAPSASVASEPLPAPRAMRDVRFADRIARGVLPNGIAWRYVATPQNDTVHVRGILPAGSAYAPGRPMLATVVADLLARGTQSHPRAVLEERLERAGVRRAYSVDGNAAYGYDPLAFRFVGACTLDRLPLLLETLAEELREPAFDERELALVKSELAGSLRLARTNTTFRAAQRFLQLAYEPGDPNDAPDVDALLADVEAIDLDAVRAYHANVVLGAIPLVSGAGAAPDGAFAAMLGEAFASVPIRTGAERPLPTVRSRAPRAVRERIDLERKANVDIVLGRPTTLVRASDDFLAASLANGILGQSTLSSRLGLRLRDREGLTYGVTSSFLAAGRIPGPWRINVSVNPTNVERAIASALDVMTAYATQGPTAREIVAQRNSMAGQLHVSLATSGGIAAQLERMAYYELPDDYVDAYRERLEAIERADVEAAIVKYLGPNDLIVTAAGTFTESPK
jgi:zinc protease